MTGIISFFIIGLNNPAQQNYTVFTVSGLIILGILFSLYLIRFQNEFIQTISTKIFTVAKKEKFYKENISKIREAKASGNNKGVVMKKEEINQTAEKQTNTLSNVAVGIAVIIVILALILFVRKRRKSSQM